MTPINAISKRAYTGKQNITTLTSTNYAKQERLNETQAKMIGYQLKPEAKAFPIVWVDRENIINADSQPEVKIRLLIHLVYNVQDIVKAQGEGSIVRNFGYGAFKKPGSKSITEKQQKYILSLNKKIHPHKSDEELKADMKKISTMTSYQAAQAINALLAVSATPH